MSDFGEDFMLCGEDEEDYGLVSTFFITSQHIKNFLHYVLICTNLCF